MRNISPLISAAFRWMGWPVQEPVWKRKSFKKSLSWAERNGFNNWEQDSHALAAFEEDHGRITLQPYPISQFAVFSASRALGTYFQDGEFHSDLFATPFDTGLRTAKALEPVVGPENARRILGPLLEEMERRAEHNARGQDEFLLARVAEVLSILGSGRSVDEVLDIMQLAPEPSIALSAFTNDISIEYAAEVLAFG